MSARFWTIVVGAVALFCAPAPASVGEIDRFINAWHNAAARADADAYFGAMTEDCVFIGTDATERWTREQLREWAAQYFEGDSAWVFRSTQRNIMLASGGQLAWFDEQLDSPHMGAVRGTGIVVKTNAGWKMKHYTLSFAVPNALADELVMRIAEHEQAEESEPAMVENVRIGRWLTIIETPGGNVPFELMIEEGPAGELTAFYTNADEWIPVSIAEWRDGLLVFEMDMYESLVVMQLQKDGTTMYGHYSRRKGGFKWDRLAISATFSDAPRFPRHTPEKFSIEPAFTPIDGKWRVVFENKPNDPAIGIFETIDGTEVHGTFLTTVGDYRYLEGSYEHGRLRLSVFDGAHCFRFDAQVDEHGTMRGTFQSGEHFNTAFTATRSQDVKLSDPFALTKWTGGGDLGAFTFKDPDGIEWALDDARFAGKARIIQVMGTWCPNCKDETSYLIELHNTYAARGLSIMAVSYEITGDENRNAEIVRTFIERMGVPYPVLIAGGSDGASKRKAKRVLGFLDKVISYPTTIFIDNAGTVRAVHTGFMGPATGEEHLKLRAAFEGLIEEMLGE